MNSRPTLLAAPAAADGLADRRLETLAQALAAALPCTDRVSIAVLGLLSTGRPVGQRDIAAALSGAGVVAQAEAEAVVNAAVRQMPYLEFDADGRGPLALPRDGHPGPMLDRAGRRRKRHTRGGRHLPCRAGAGRRVL